MENTLTEALSGYMAVHQSKMDRKLERKYGNKNSNITSFDDAVKKVCRDITVKYLIDRAKVAIRRGFIAVKHKAEKIVHAIMNTAPMVDNTTLASSGDDDGGGGEDPDPDRPKRQQFTHNVTQSKKVKNSLIFQWRFAPLLILPELRLWRWAV
jgi:hypothetical protein